MRISRMRIGAFALAAFAALMALFIPANLPAWQKSIRFDRITPEDGLPEEYVMSMAQDSFGYLWFGTGSGLAKYDGHRFTVYRPDPDKPDSLSSSTVISVFVDREGTIWAGTDVGLDRFDRATETFTHFRHDPEDEDSMGGKVVKEIFEDSEGNLWVGHWFSGISRLDRATGTFKRFVHDPDNGHSLPPGAVFEITEDSRGHIWVGTLNGERTADAAKLSPETGTFRRIFTCKTEDPDCPKPESQADRPENHYVVSIFESPDGAFWFGGGDLTRFDPEANTYQSYLHRFAPESEASYLLSDGANGFWLLSSSQGLFHFNPESNELSNYRHDKADPSSIASDILNTPFRDRDGRIWITAYEGGVSSFDPENLSFGLYRYQGNDPNTIFSAENINNFAVDKTGTIWLSYESHVNRIGPDRESALVIHASESLGSGDCLGRFGSIAIARNETVWFGSDHGMCRFDPESKKIKRFPPPDPDLLTLDGDPNDYGVGGIREDPEGFLWFSAPLGMNRFDPETGEVENFLPESEGGQRDFGGHIGANLFDEDERYWFGSTTSLLLLDKNTGEITTYSHDPDDPGSISPGFITAIVKHNGYWVGTASGLDRFDPETERFSPVNDRHGDSLGILEDIVIDRDDNMWISSSNGLWRMDPQTEELIHFGVSDGIAYRYMGDGQLLDSGEVMFLGGDGFNLFDPAQIKQKDRFPEVVVTDFLLNNRPVPISSGDSETQLKQGIDLVSSLDLSWRDRVFAFEFAALEFSDPGKITYGYLLDGFHEDWIESDHEHRVATMTNVPPGNYEFRVRARYEKGGWQERSNPISITILSPPWKTWWAYLSYAAALLAITAFIYRYQTAALRRRAEELEKAVADRTLELRNHEKEIQALAEGLEIQLERNEQLIANISHEFRTPLTLILGPANRLLRKVAKPENQALLQMIRRNSHRLLRLVDQLLGLSRLKAGDQLAREAQSVNAAVDGIAGSFGPAVVERELKLNTFAEPELWVLCTPDTLDNIVLNLLSNAVKNTPEGGSITVHAEGDGEEWVQISVEDTGVGISEQDQEVVFDRFHRLGDQKEQMPGSGIGLALVRELAIEHGGHVELASKLQKGTRVTVTLPRTSRPTEEVDSKSMARIAGRTELEVETARESEPASKPRRNIVDSDRLLVLVVEDNTDMRQYLGELLALKYDVIEAENGAEAVKLAVEYVPDLVLCDIVMPGMDGFQVSHELKEDERTCHVPIILLTARHDRDSRLEGWKEKVDGYLTKPFNDEELLLRISNLLEIREILKSRFTDHFFSENGKNGMQPKDRAFLNKLELAMEQHHADEHFGLEQMADVLYVSPRQLQRKLKAVTGQNPAGFLRAYRLRKARKLLKTGMAVGLVADAVGFSSPAYFSSCFKAQFAFTPSEYQAHIRDHQG